jgi:hypothetical protein
LVAQALADRRRLQDGHQRGADAGPERERDADGGADKAKVLVPVLLGEAFCGVDHVSLGDRDASSKQACPPR